MASTVLEKEAYQAISLDGTERLVGIVKAKWEENKGLGACPQKSFFGTMPSRMVENAFLEHMRALLSSFFIAL